MWHLQEVREGQSKVQRKHVVGCPLGDRARSRHRDDERARTHPRSPLPPQPLLGVKTSSSLSPSRVTTTGSAEPSERPTRAATARSVSGVEAETSPSDTRRSSRCMPCEQESRREVQEVPDRKEEGEEREGTHGRVCWGTGSDGVDLGERRVASASSELAHVRVVARCRFRNVRRLVAAREAAQDDVLHVALEVVEVVAEADDADAGGADAGDVDVGAREALVVDERGVHVDVVLREGGGGEEVSEERRGRG